MALFNEPTWVYSEAHSDFYFPIDPHPSSKEQAREFLVQMFDEEQLKGMEYGLAVGTTMPQKFPIDLEQIDEALADLFYEEYPSEQNADAFSDLMDSLQGTWEKWNEKHKVVGNSLQFLEGAFQVVENDTPDAG